MPLSIVATPIGHRLDITLRALEVLRSADIVLCEDTRVTMGLLALHGITAKTMSYHQHSGSARIEEIRSLLAAGSHLALVSDAGTPGINDPGNFLIQELVRADAATPISPIPGPSAMMAALSISGFPTDKFSFLGFPPHKNKRKKFFETVAASPYTTVFYESNHRIQKCLESLAEVLSPEQRVCVCRELTKQFETIYRGTIEEILAKDIVEKGEFVVVVEQSKKRATDVEDDAGADDLPTRT